ncbi:hypothetical protein VULLAG_LOCUS3163 [Vulpes lagopus]
MDAAQWFQKANPALSHHPVPLVLEVLKRVGLEKEDIDVFRVRPVVKRWGD